MYCNRVVSRSGISTFSSVMVLNFFARFFKFFFPTCGHAQIRPLYTSLRYTPAMDDVELIQYDPYGAAPNRYNGTRFYQHSFACHTHFVSNILPLFRTF